MSIILKGNELSKSIKENVLKETSQMTHKPLLAVITFDDDFGSNVYLKSKERDCRSCGIDLIIKNGNVDLVGCITELNNDKSVDGIILDFPLPLRYNKEVILSLLSPNKDVDCVSIQNQGKLMLELCEIQSCTPKGIIKLLKFYNIEITGKKMCYSR